MAGRSDDTWGTPWTAHAGYADAFIAELTSAGALSSNGFLGSTGLEEGWDVAPGLSGNVYVAGNSSYTWGSPVNAFSPSLDAFAVKISPCAATPLANCKAPGKAIITIKNLGDPTKNQVQWRWLKGTVPAPTHFGDPTNSTRYNLCFYQGSTPLGAPQLLIEPREFGGKPARVLCTV